MDAKEALPVYFMQCNSDPGGHYNKGPYKHSHGATKGS